jgi:hypothetical protein
MVADVALAASHRSALTQIKLCHTLSLVLIQSLKRLSYMLASVKVPFL